MKKTYIIVLIMLTINMVANGLEISLHIKGSLEEILNVMECLKSIGVTGTLGNEQIEDPLKVHIFSSTTKTEEENTVVRTLGFQQIVVEPTAPKPGEKVKISAKVFDEAGEIDTISASIMGMGIHSDLRDDGENGDEVGGDGVWSGILTLPEDVKGRIVVVITAYDSNGKVIQSKNLDGTLKPIMGISEVYIQGEESQQK
ncbi:MAG: hypothetical protein N3G21_00955 [Candidatus Hydrogenedentes bacterium]|nr:hypothetical protein [Candidatus Hydrogenedentota bacterium]